MDTIQGEVQMKLAIVRTSPTVMSSDTYNVQELGLGRALVDRGIGSDVYLAGASPGPIERTIRTGSSAKCREIRLPARAVSRIGVLRGLLDWLPEGGYSLVQVHDDTQVESVRVAEWAHGRGLPVVLCQGMYANYAGALKSAMQASYDAVILPRLRRACDGVIAKSQSAAEYAERKGFDNIVVMPIGLDEDAFRDSPSIDWRRRLGLAKNSPIVLYVGILERRRRPDVLIDAVSRLIERGSSATLVVVGTGPLTDDVASRGAESLGDRFRLIPRLEQSELPSLYAEATVTALVSQYEIYGMAALESLYFGTPVVASSVGGLREIGGGHRGGTLVESYDPSDWADALGAILGADEADLRTRSEAASAHSSRLTWDAVIGGWADFYRRLV